MPATSFTWSLACCHACCLPTCCPNLPVPHPVPPPLLHPPNGGGTKPHCCLPTSTPCDLPPAALQYNPDIVQRFWQYEPWLPPRSIRQGLFSLGEPARMRRFVDKLLSGGRGGLVA